MKNLITDKWLPFRMRDGTETVRLLSAISDPDVIDFALPRADFQGAAYQLAIGLLQTLQAPADKQQWLAQYRQPPRPQELQSSFEQAAHAFNLVGEGPLFMQDWDSLADAKLTSVSALLIEAPGGNGLKLNTDHFVKRGIGECLSLPMAAIALYTLQINAPSGGQGHRTGLRGGGPLTTLVIAGDASASLWHKLWLNVLIREYVRYPQPDLHSAEVFPWLAPTRTSEKKGSEVYPEDVHPLQMYWAMPRRIRLHVEESPEPCQITPCQLSGEPNQQTITQYRTQNYGVNYGSTWQHWLTPYKFDPRKPDADCLSVKGQPGGLTYKTWDVLTLAGKSDNGKSGQIPAQVVSQYQRLCDDLGQSENPNLWVFGYDMDNMKARGWYSTSLPLLAVDAERQQEVLDEVKDLQALANQTLWHCRSQIKAAWFDKPGDAKGDFSAIDMAFWQQTENAFFRAVAAVVANTLNDDDPLTPEQALSWLNAIRNTALALFDHHVMSELGTGRAMSKRIKARRFLCGALFGGKEIKNFMTTNGINSPAEANS